MKNKIDIKSEITRTLKEERAQGSAEMILLVGAILVIVLVAGNYIFNITSTINNSFKEVIKSGRNSIISKI